MSCNTATAAIRARWHELIGSHADMALSELLAAYGGPGRHYHGLGHIAALLVLSRQYAASLGDHAVVDLAILYHDAVYEPVRSDNEARSAELAKRKLGAAGIGTEAIDRVARYIAATKHEGSIPTGDGDLDHLLDFDLSILAAAPDVYDAYVRAIRREYAVFPDLLYRPGRAKVLRAFLGQSSLYRVPAMGALWEAQARVNLANELAALS